MAGSQNIILRRSWRSIRLPVVVVVVVVVTVVVIIVMIIVMSNIYLVVI